MTAAGALYIISAPSGAGKTSLVKKLLETTPQVEVSVSYTTRPPRPGERDGVDYHFVTPAHFQRLLRQEALLEHAQVFDHWYGAGRDAVSERLRRGVDVILTIDWQGARQVKAKAADVCTIFILPPSREILRQRLEQRGQDDPAVIERRMRAAIAEMSHYAEFDYIVVNDDFAEAVEALRAIVLANRQRRDRQLRRQAELLSTLLS